MERKNIYERPDYIKDILEDKYICQWYKTYIKMTYNLPPYQVDQPKYDNIILSIIDYGCLDCGGSLLEAKCYQDKEINYK